jgi:hypothetical protein
MQWMRRLIVSWTCGLALCAWQSPPVAWAQAAPDTIEEAIARIAAIKDPDPFKQDELKARAAYQMVTDRIKITNDISGSVLQTIPVDFWNYFSSCSNIKSRAQALDIARAKGWDIARASWMVKAGACDENASLMQELLTRGGVKNVVVMRSDSPHAFPVIGLAPDADPDIPWTWGPHAFVADSWSRTLYPPPLAVDKIWNDGLYFGSGSHFVAPGPHTTTRELLRDMVKKGDDFIKQHCDAYRPAIAKFMLIPAQYRAKMAFKPTSADDLCPLAAWAGDKWTGFKGRSRYDIRLAGNVLAIKWTTDAKPEGEYYDCKLSGQASEVADCKWRQEGIGGTVHLVFKKEAAGDRISGKAFDGKTYWDVDIFREH